VHGIEARHSRMSCAPAQPPRSTVIPLRRFPLQISLNCVSPQARVRSRDPYLVAPKSSRACSRGNPSRVTRPLTMPPTLTASPHDHPFLEITLNPRSEISANDFPSFRCFPVYFLPWRFVFRYAPEPEPTYLEGSERRHPPL